MLPPVHHLRNYTLESYQTHHLNKYLEMALDKEVLSFMGGVSGSVIEETKLFNKIFALYQVQEDRWFWVWAVTHNNRLVAHVELKETALTTKDELEIVYMVHPAERRKGVMVEVLEFLKSSQKEWNKKITATVDETNIASMSLLKKWGIEKQELMKDENNGEEFLKIWLANV